MNAIEIIGVFKRFREKGRFFFSSLLFSFQKSQENRQTGKDELKIQR